LIPYINSPGANVKNARVYTNAASKYAPGGIKLPATVAGSGSVSTTQTGAGTSAPSPGGLDSNFFLNLINSDPVYTQDKADYSAQGIQDSQSAVSGIVRALVQRGIVPDLNNAAETLGLSSNVLNFLKNNVDFGRAATLAKQATDSGVSQEAQLQKQHTDNVSNIKSSLAARGLAESGAAPSLLGREADQYKVQRFGADRQTSDFINGAIAAFAQAERARQDALRQSASAAADRARQNMGSAPPPVPPPAAGTSSDFTDFMQALVQAAKTGRAVAM
jgi:hypothetical protein